MKDKIEFKDLSPALKYFVIIAMIGQSIQVCSFILILIAVILATILG